MVPDFLGLTLLWYLSVLIFVAVFLWFYSSILLWMFVFGFMMMYLAVVLFMFTSRLFFTTSWIFSWFFLTLGMIWIITFLFHDLSPNSLTSTAETHLQVCRSFSTGLICLLLYFYLFFRGVFFASIPQSGYYFLTYFPFCGLFFFI